MKVLRVAQTCYPDVTGGGAYHVHAMSRDQAELGHDVTVLTVRTDEDQAHVEERDGYTVVRYDATASLLGNEFSAGLARHLHRADGFDVVHAHSHLYCSTNLAALERRLGETPLAITNHGLYSQTAPEWMFDWYLRTLGRWTFDRADLAFCYTEVDERRLRAVGVTTDVEVVPNGVDTDRFTPDGPGSDRVDDGPAILFVGRLVDGKRPGDAVAAIERVRQRIPDARLYLCGKGPLRETLESRAESLESRPEASGSGSSGDEVTFLGHVPYDTMPRVYRSADVLVLPSRAEGMPRTVLEARASGTPVVASDLEHVQSLDDEGVRAVPVGDVDRLAAAIVSVLDDGGTDPATGTDPTTAGTDPAATAEVDPSTTTEADPSTAGADPTTRTGAGPPTTAGTDPATADGDGRPSTAGTARASVADGGTARTEYDWSETVRRTTTALCELSEHHE